MRRKDLHDKYKGTTIRKEKSGQPYKDNYVRHSFTPQLDTRTARLETRGHHAQTVPYKENGLKHGHYKGISGR